MNTEKIVYESLSDITGLGIDDLKQIEDLDLFKSGILNSLAFVNFISCFERLSGKKCDISRLKITELSTIKAIIATLSNI